MEEQNLNETAMEQPVVPQPTDNEAIATSAIENETNEMTNEQGKPVAEKVTPEESAQAVIGEMPENQHEAEAAELSETTEKELPDEVTAKEPEPAFVEPEADYSAMGREELVGAFEELLKDEDVTHIKNRVAELKNRFHDLEKEHYDTLLAKYVEEGGNKEDYSRQDDQISEAYSTYYAEYRKRRQAYMDELEAAKQRNLVAKEAVLESLKQLVERGEENMRKANDEFKELQERWKQIGEVPRDKMNDLWQQYHFLIEQFFNKMRINRELRDLDMKRNLEQKLQLCEKAEELIVETSIDKAFKAMQDIRRCWKETGPVPVEQNEEIWQRFCNAVNKIEERRKEYYEQRKEELEKNLLAKQALVEKAEELTTKPMQSTKDWNDTSAELDGLLKMWKAIGPVPREVNEEIWVKFKGHIDKHYEQKKAHFGQLRDEQSNNYNKKIDLCLKAEAIAKRDDWRKATDELLQLQKEWKEIGPVSRKVSEKIWHRFRSACDEFFSRKTEYFNSVHGSEKENLQKKESLIEQLKQFEFGENKEENLRVIKDFQRQWMEIGFVPIADKERLQKEFRRVIDEHFEKLKISAIEAEENNYRARLRNVGGDVKKFVSGERNEILNKIASLKNDISLWENNIGFFSNSRQADILKEEFEKKMQHTRQQIALLEAKLKILKESENGEGENKTGENK